MRLAPALATAAPCAAAPLARFARLMSHDLDEVRQQGGRVFCDHELRIVGPRQSLDTQLYYRPLRHLGLGRLSYGATVDIDPGALQHFYLMQWPLRGGEVIHTSHGDVHSSPSVGTLINPTDRFHMRHQADAEKLFVRIEQRALAQLAERLNPGAKPAPLEFAPALPFADAALTSLRGLLSWLFYEASDGSLLDSPLLVAQIEETFLLSMLQALPHNRPELRRTQPAVAPGFVIRAEEYMAAQAHEPLTVADVAAKVGVSLRSLYAGFRRHRGRTPMEHLRTLRLDRARAELNLPRDEATSVTTVALRWGFGHLGQFAADYKARFGELPSSTLRRARGR